MEKLSDEVDTAIEKREQFDRDLYISLHYILGWININSN